jgi:hypothetical protein
VRGVIAALLLEDLLPVLEVMATAPNRTTGLAAPTEAVPGSLSAIVLGQGLALVAIGAGLRLQDLSRKLFFGCFLLAPGQKLKLKVPLTA